MCTAVQEIRSSSHSAFVQFLKKNYLLIFLLLMYKFIFGIKCYLLNERNTLGISSRLCNSNMFSCRYLQRRALFDSVCRNSFLSLFWFKLEWLSNTDNRTIAVMSDGSFCLFVCLCTALPSVGFIFTEHVFPRWNRIGR